MTKKVCPVRIRLQNADDQILFLPDNSTVSDISKQLVNRIGAPTNVNHLIHLFDGTNDISNQHRKQITANSIIKLVPLQAFFDLTFLIADSDFSFKSSFCPDCTVQHIRKFLAHSFFFCSETEFVLTFQNSSNKQNGKLSHFLNISSSVTVTIRFQQQMFPLKFRFTSSHWSGEYFFSLWFTRNDTIDTAIQKIAEMFTSDPKIPFPKHLILIKDGKLRLLPNDDLESEFGNLAKIFDVIVMPEMIYYRLPDGKIVGRSESGEMTAAGAPQKVLGKAADSFQLWHRPYYFPRCKSFSFGIFAECPD
jgi:hypothetical protein